MNVADISRSAPKTDAMHHGPVFGAFFYEPLALSGMIYFVQEPRHHQQ
jgi:hypothetical protein